MPFLRSSSLSTRRRKYERIGRLGVVGVGWGSLRGLFVAASVPRGRCWREEGKRRWKRFDAFAQIHRIRFGGRGILGKCRKCLCASRYLWTERRTAASDDLYTLMLFSAKDPPPRRAPLPRHSLLPRTSTGRTDAGISAAEFPILDFLFLRIGASTKVTCVVKVKPDDPTGKRWTPF